MSDTIHYARGVFLNSIKIWLSDRFGKDGVNTIKDKLSPQAVEMFNSPSANQWYKASLIKELYQIIYDEFSGMIPDVMADYGTFSASRDASGILRYLMRLINMNKLLNRMSSFWKHYNRGATIEAGPVIQKNNRKSVVLTVRDYDLGKPGCQVLSAYYKEICTRAKAKNVEVEKLTCVHDNDDVCSWEVSWEN